MSEKQKKVSAFIRNTYHMLQNQDHNDIVSWSRSGCGFIIKNVSRFSQDVLPQYFKHKNYESFVRQLNMYGFHKQRQQNDFHEFAHQTFRRGALLQNNCSLLVAGLKRKPQKKKKKESSIICRSVLSPSKDPKFNFDDNSNQQRSVSIVLKSEQNQQHQYGESSLQSDLNVEYEIAKEQQNRRYTCKEKDDYKIDSNVINEGQWGNEIKKSSEELIITQNEQLIKLHSFIRQSLLELKLLKSREGLMASEDEQKAKLKKVEALINAIECQKTRALQSLQRFQQGMTIEHINCNP